MIFDANQSLVGDLELQQFFKVEAQKRRFELLVHELTDQCWDICIGKVTNKLDGKTESCLNNCVERFIDASNFIVNRLEKTQLVEKASAFD